MSEFLLSVEGRSLNFKPGDLGSNPIYVISSCVKPLIYPLSASVPPLYGGGKISHSIPLLREENEMVKSLSIVPGLNKGELNINSVAKKKYILQTAKSTV